MLTDPHLLDLWCALNSSFGGPLLAIVTLGGLLAVGRSLISFPTPAGDTVEVADRNRYNRRRRGIQILGLFTAVFLLGEAICYVIAFGAVRKGATACVDPPLTPDGRCALTGFFGVLVGCALIGAIYALVLERFKRVQP